MIKLTQNKIELFCVGKIIKLIHTPTHEKIYDIKIINKSRNKKTNISVSFGRCLRMYMTPKRNYFPFRNEENRRNKD